MVHSLMASQLALKDRHSTGSALHMYPPACRSGDRLRSRICCAMALSANQEGPVSDWHETVLIQDLVMCNTYHDLPSNSANATVTQKKSAT